MSAYTIYKELFPAQTVEHVKYGQFTSPDATNLIVAKASLLQIYDFVEYTPTDTTVIETQDDQTEMEADDDAQDRFNDKDEQVTYSRALSFSFFFFLLFFFLLFAGINARKEKKNIESNKRSCFLYN